MSIGARRRWGLVFVTLGVVLLLAVIVTGGLP